MTVKRRFSSGMETFNLSTAFVAGILSFLSPCILPLLPGYLSFITGYSLDQTDEKAYNFRAVKGALVFGLGFTIIFVLMGATATAIGRVIVQNLHVLSIIMGIIVIILGLHMLGIFRIKFLYNEKKIHIKAKKESKHPLIQAFLLGLAFAIGWTPCIGPILGGILTMAAHQDSVRSGMMLLSSYSIGLWLPFMLAALFTAPVLGWLAKHPKIALRAQQIAGIVLIIMGALLLTGQMARLSALLA